MIKLKNQGEVVENLQLIGAQAVGTEKAIYVVPFAVQLKAIFAKLGTAGVTGSQIVEIKKNGVTIFSDAVKLTFATAVQAATYGPLTVNPTKFAKGDVITVDITQIHTTPAKGCSILLTFQRLKGSGPVGAMQTDTVGTEAE